MKSNRSYTVVGEGGMDMWEDMKAASQKIVRVHTDEVEVAVAHLIRQSPHSIRIATYGPTRPGNSETQETGRRPRCQVLDIPRNRITKFQELN